MPYDTEIAKIEQETFVELYELIMGLEVERYTSYAEDVAFRGYTYEARPIKRSDFKMSKDYKATRVSVTAPISNIVQQFIASAPIPEIELKIIRSFLNDIDNSYIVLFQGYIIDVSLKANIATIQAENNIDMKLVLPKFVFQSRCNNKLFDDICSLQAIDWKLETTVTVSGSTLQSSDFANYPDGWFTFGYIEKNNDFRLITNHIGNTVTLQMPFPSSTLQSGQSIYAYPGCDKSATTCRDKFNNLANFTGFPYIPSSNPTIWGF